jgi:hypothetical protein
MRRLLSVAAMLGALLAFPTGCGGGADSPLDEALGYLPDDAVFVFVVSTDFEGDDYEQVRQLLDRFPQGNQAGALLRNEFEDSSNVDYEDDVKPVLGNELVIGVPAAEDFQGDDEGFVMALQAKDGDKAEEFVQKNADEVGEVDGANIYESESGGTFTTLKDDTIVLSGQREMVEQALETRDGDDRLREDDFDEAFGDLPDDALVRMYGDAQKLLEGSEDPDAAAALKSKWVSSLRKFAITVDALDDGVETQFRLETEGLSEEDLPIAAGSESPAVVARENEVSFALRNVTQSIKFGEATAQSVDATQFGQYQAAKSALGRRLGINVDEDVYGQFEGDTSVTVSLDGKFASRSELRDAAAFEETLAKLADEPELLEQLLGGDEEIRIEKPRGDEKLYGLVSSDGDRLVFGVVDGVFVVANDPEKAEQIASAQPEQVEGAEGAFALKADGQAIANEIAEDVLGTELGALAELFGGIDAFTEPVGDLTGSIRHETDALTGRFKLFVEE